MLSMSQCFFFFLKNKNFFKELAKPFDTFSRKIQRDPPDAILIVGSFIVIEVLEETSYERKWGIAPSSDCWGILLQLSS